MSPARPLKFLGAIVVEFGSLALLICSLPLSSGEHLPPRDSSTALAAPIVPPDRHRFVEQTLDSSRARLVAALEAHLRETADSVLASQRRE